MEPLTFSLSHTAKPIVRVRFSLYRIKSKQCLFYADRNYGLLPFATLTSLLRSSTKILRTQDTLDSAHPATYICIMSVVAVLGSMSQCAVLPAKTHWPADSEDQAEVWGQSSRLACARFHTQPTGGGSRTLQGCPILLFPTLLFSESVYVQDGSVPWRRCFRCFLMQIYKEGSKILQLEQKGAK